MQITTSRWNSVRDGGLPKFTRLLVQNRGAVSIFLDTAAGSVKDTGVEIKPGAAYETPARVRSIFLATASGTATDVRVVVL